jgi:Mg-chelatase subunit ChlD
MTDHNSERLRRWRLLLGGGAAEGTGCSLSALDSRMDAALGALYNGGEWESEGKSKSKRGGLGSSAPNVARWLGDIREFFPTSVVQVLQKDALSRLNLQKLLLEPELLAMVEADVNLVAGLVALRGVMPAKVKDTARIVVRKVVDELLQKLAEPMRSAVNGALNRGVRNNRPRLREIDWSRTIRANLKHYQPKQRTIIPERRIGFGRKRQSLKEIVLCVDQSGSMATSAVYSGIFGAVLASLPAVSTKMVVFDTAIVDLTPVLSDPVEAIFGIQLGGGTDINLALGYCQGIIERPSDTVLVLISDLYEGGNEKQMLQRAAQLVASGVRLVALLALSDDGAPSFDAGVAEAFAGLGIPAFACTPDAFPDLMAAAISGQDVGAWAAAQGIVAARGKK